MAFPGAVIFVSEDLYSDGYYSTQTNLETQLFIAETMDGYEFDARVSADPNYADIIRLTGRRILVTRDFSDLTNRTLADVVIFVKNGLAGIEANKYGPPGATYPVKSLNIYQLIPRNIST